jgi:hypothetical protein
MLDKRTVFMGLVLLFAGGSLLAGCASSGGGATAFSYSGTYAAGQGGVRARNPSPDGSSRDPRVTVKSRALCTFVPPQVSDRYAAMLLTSSFSAAVRGA